MASIRQELLASMGRPTASDCKDALYHVVYGLPQTGKRLIDSVAFGDAPAVVYPASVVESCLSRADMESASPLRQSLQAGVKLPEKLSASNPLQGLPT